MESRYDELTEIFIKVNQNPEDVSKDIKKRFWRLVREIKREPAPDSEEIKQAAKIRDILFEVKRGKTYPLKSTLAIQFTIGIIVSVIPFLYSLTLPLDWFGIFTWTLSEWGIFGLRFITVFLGIALFYPIGRLIGARALGIKLMGVCRDDMYEPTLRIDYVSFLHTSPDKRKWFFFMGGIWTVITSFLYWILGFVFANDFTGLIPCIVLLLLEGYVIASGQAKHTRGEMGFFNRERKIERAWRKKLEALEQL